MYNNENPTESQSINMFQHPTHQVNVSRKKGFCVRRILANFFETPCMLVDLSFMLVWLTKFYLSDVSLIERHQHFSLLWENNRAVSIKHVKQRSLCKDVHRAHDERLV